MEAAVKGAATNLSRARRVARSSPPAAKGRPPAWPVPYSPGRPSELAKRFLPIASQTHRFTAVRVQPQNVIGWAGPAMLYESMEV